MPKAVLSSKCRNICGCNSRFIRIKGHRFHYTEYPGSGPDMVMLHGFASSSYTWDKIAPVISSSGYHVYCPDMKGFGFSDKPVYGDYDPLLLMEEINQWMEAIGLSRVIFVGNSLGGAIALLFAVHYPEKVEKLVLVDAGGYPMIKPLIIQMLRLPIPRRFFQVFFKNWMIRWNLEEVYCGRELVTQEQVLAYFDRIMNNNGLFSQIALARSLDFNLFHKYFKQIRDLDIDTLVLWGKDDKWIPLEIGCMFKRDIKRSKLVVIPDCGHIPQEECPEITCRVILDFLAGKNLPDYPIPDDCVFLLPYKPQSYSKFVAGPVINLVLMMRRLYIDARMKNLTKRRWQRYETRETGNRERERKTGLAN